MKKYDNFCRALDNLKEIYDYDKPYSNVTRSGLVALFNICFEQSWKAMKEILENQGYAKEQVYSPKMVIRTAYQAGMVDDELLWLDALNARNNVTHVYNSAVAEAIIDETKNGFVAMFADLKNNIEKNWL